MRRRQLFGRLVTTSFGVAIVCGGSGCAVQPGSGAATTTPAATTSAVTPGQGNAIAASERHGGPPAPKTSALQKELAGIAPARALAPSDAQSRLSGAIDRYFRRTPSRRMYLAVDKPLYQPGETMWFRVWELSGPTLTEDKSQHGVTAQLVSPKGAVVLQKRIRATTGVATNDFAVPAGAVGGEYTIRVFSDRGGSAKRKVIVASYQPPRIKKKLEFLRKAYGAGDVVEAALSLHRATGEPLATHRARAIVSVDGRETARVSVTTGRRGDGVVKFQLPAHIARGDGLLTVLVPDGGVTESIQKRIPIVLHKLRFAMYPEGGELVAGLPGRVYFAAKNTIGKPADVEGRVVDEAGRVLAHIRSFHNGMGRFEITPKRGKTYHVKITKPVGISQTFTVPAVTTEGCSMEAVDDFASARDDVRVGVWCTKPRRVVATAVLRGRRLGDIAVRARADKPTVVALPVPPGAQGAVRVTLFDAKLRPLAERLIYHGLGRNLKVKLTADHASYSPRDPISVTVKTTDLAGDPVAADLSLAAVDDTVLSMANDKTANFLARVYLESEMPGQKVAEPNFYFSGKPGAARGIDLVLGTQGWRRFNWRRVLVRRRYPRPYPRPYPRARGWFRHGRALPPRAQRPAAAPRPAPPPAMAKAARAPVDLDGMPRPFHHERRPMGGAVRAQGQKPLALQQRRFAAIRRRRGGAMEAAKKWKPVDRQRRRWALVREFPVPNYKPGYEGPRTDFRETIYWNPSVKTSDDGKAVVRFFASDAITSFRITAEGVSGGGLPGRAETVVKSVRPVSLSVKMPVAVSAGDEMRLPITIANETHRRYRAALSAVFGPAFSLKGALPKTVSLAAGEHKSLFATLKVVGNGEKPSDGKIVVEVDAAHLEDEVKRTIRVQPLGFPQKQSLSGTLSHRAHHAVDLSSALPGTIQARVTLYPSPLATMVKGLAAMIREPSGCFEQTSSANYPNVMVLSYLEEHHAAKPALIARTEHLLDHGYKRLTGYETPKRGYEWFGRAPGHEALTAYGLLEFADMKKVYGDVSPAMVRRTRAWLLGRRDGKGGFKRNPRALDSFGRADAKVTNGYITYALTAAGERDLPREIAYQKRVAQTTRDPYLMALATNTLLNVKRNSAAARRAAKKLAGMQSKTGVFDGAKESITRSGGLALKLETTALASLALMKAGGGYIGNVRRAVKWINGHRGGFGRFGSTQSTVLSLKALTRYAEMMRRTRTGGAVSLVVNGKPVGRIRFKKGRKQAIVFNTFAKRLRPGKNDISLRLDSKTSLPYSIAITYRSKKPASSPETKVALSAKLDKARVPIGEPVKLDVTVDNKTGQGQPMTLARVGIPGGLAFQTWQLKELVKKRTIAFYETRPREVILYFRALAPHAHKHIPIDLLARVPGTYVGPASSAYLYYTDEYKDWVAPARVTVTR